MTPPQHANLARGCVPRVVNSTWSNGAAEVLPSQDFAGRLPVVPVMMIASGRPLTLPDGLTISWMIGAMLPVR